MPRTEVYFFQDHDGRAPVVEWMEELRGSDLAAYEKRRALIARLKEAGHELRRPTADFLRDGIHELRARKGHVNYRLLYFFHSRNIAVVAHALTKEDAVPDAAIERALRRKGQYEADPERHTFEME